MILARRSFLTGLGAALITAPAIVRAGSLMPVKLIVDDGIALNAIAHPTGRPIPLSALRETLLPGFWEVAGKFETIEHQWGGVFAKGGLRIR